MYVLDIIITSRTRRKILALFCLNPKRYFYLRETAREIGEGVNAVRQELNYLERKGVLISSAEGRNRYFLLNNQLPNLDKLKEIIKSELDSGSKEFEFTDFERRDKLEENLSSVVSSLKIYYQPDKIILFGSLAGGKVRPWSDIDLAIIKSTDKDYYDRIREVLSICDYDVGIDFFVWTPEEFEEKIVNKTFVKSEILKKGKVIYEKG